MNRMGLRGDPPILEYNHPYRSAPSQYNANCRGGKHIDAERYDSSDEEADMHSDNVQSNRVPAAGMYPSPTPRQELYSSTSSDPIITVLSIASSQRRLAKASQYKERDVHYYPYLAHGFTSTMRFRRAADLQRHYQSAHSDDHFDCPIRKCPREGENDSIRKDQLRDLLKDVVLHMRDHSKDVHMQSPGDVKPWMDEVQTGANLRYFQKNVPAQIMVTA